MKRWLAILVLLIGISFGATSALIGPRLVSRYLPEAIRGKTSTVEGQVVRKQREGGRLLLTVVTAQGGLLATFREKGAAVDLLVEQGDTLTLVLPRYEPFVENPVIERVRKTRPADRP